MAGPTQCPRLPGCWCSRKAGLFGPIGTARKLISLSQREPRKPNSAHCHRETHPQLWGRNQGQPGPACESGQPSYPRHQVLLLSSPGPGRSQTSIRSFDKYLPGTGYLPGTVQSREDAAENGGGRSTCPNERDGAWKTINASYKPRTGAKAGGHTKQGRVTGHVDGGEGATAEYTWVKYRWTGPRRVVEGSRCVSISA